MPESEAERAAAMQAWEAWFTELGTAVSDQGNPFAPAAKRITAGPAIADTSAAASGYSVLHADDLEQAAKLASGCPVLQGGAEITVFDTIDLM
jgi:hypothetical protein